jgi:hypothetical protein
MSNKANLNLCQHKQLLDIICLKLKIKARKGGGRRTVVEGGATVGWKRGEIYIGQVGVEREDETTYK